MDANEKKAVDRLVEFNVSSLQGTLTMTITTGMNLASDYKLVGKKYCAVIQAEVAKRLGWKQ